MTERAQDLPPVAAARVRHMAESKVAGSLLSAPALAGLQAVDLEPVGAVMGCIVMHLGWTGYGCGLYGGYGQGGYRPGGYQQGGFGGGFGPLGQGGNGPGGITGRGFGNQGFGGQGFGGAGGGYYTSRTPVLTSGGGAGQSWQGYGPYVRARYHAYDTALRRLLAEASALGADGVVGVTLRWKSLDSGARELIALGTAVRHRQSLLRRAPGALPYCTELTGEDVAKAALWGWRPLGIAVGLSVAIKHDDWMTSMQTSWMNGTGNVEVDGLTDLLHAARDDARKQLAGRAGRFKGAAQIVISGSDTRVGERECGEGQRDHIAEASFVGTVLAYAPALGRKPLPRASQFYR